MNVYLVIQYLDHYNVYTTEIVGVYNNAEAADSHCAYLTEHDKHHEYEVSIYNVSETFTKPSQP